MIFKKALQKMSNEDLNAVIGGELTPDQIAAIQASMLGGYGQIGGLPNLNAYLMQMGAVSSITGIPVDQLVGTVQPPAYAK